MFRIGYVCMLLYLQLRRLQ